MPFNGKDIIKGAAVAGLCLLAGAVSAFFTFRLGAFVPPLVFILLSIILFFISSIKLHPLKLVAYIIGACLIYVLTYTGTIAGSEYIPFAGVITAGLGALGCFGMVHLFIKKIPFKGETVFLAGSLPMIVNEVLGIFVAVPGELNTYQSILFGFMPFFFLWPVSVGLLLFFTLNRKETGESATLRSDYWFHFYSRDRGKRQKKNLAE